MRPTVDKAAYHLGKQDFKRNATLLDMVQQMEPTEAQEKDEKFNYNDHQNKAMSRCLGFADAFLSALRHNMRF